ncbi:hypothetical protein [Micromonospora sediminicola]|uniref:hypothetical protein n=1 Tax=Micromonospora sediminicola TaxID=946078 RepID=UPI00339FBFAF
MTAGLFAAAALSTGAVVATAAPALATPTNCSWAKYTATSIVAVCHGGTGQYRARITCRHYYGAAGDYYYTNGYGSWKSASSGQASYAYCPASGETFSSGGLDLV